MRIEKNTERRDAAVLYTKNEERRKEEAFPGAKQWARVRVGRSLRAHKRGRDVLGTVLYLHCSPLLDKRVVHCSGEGISVADSQRQNLEKKSNDKEKLAVREESYFRQRRQRQEKTLRAREE